MLIIGISYEYRQNSDFYYYCGLTEPESLIVLGTRWWLYTVLQYAEECNRKAIGQTLVYFTVERT